LEAFNHKNSFSLKERFVLKLLNQVDFKLNQGLSNCSLLNVSQEVFERPHLSFFNKNEEAGKFQVIDKYEIRNLNPYVFSMEDKSTLHVYSLLE
jgi:hypothetical protein